MKFVCWAGCLLALLGATAVAAKDEDSYVTFRCTPEATIHHENIVGPSDQPLPLHFTNGVARVVITRPGYLKQARTLDRADVSAEGFYPAEGSIALQPEHALVAYTDWISSHPVMAVAGALFGITLMGVALARLRQQKRKHRTLEKFEARRDLHDSLAMQIVGGYMLVEPLGSGGMATVYRGLPCADLDEDKAVAVKVLGREMLDDPEFRERFRREVNAYRKLCHPNIVEVYDWGELETGLIYITLELVHGQTVRAAMKDSLTPQQIHQLLESLALALGHAHERGIIHRDLKPENLMLTESGRLKVMDFGLARHEGEERLTRTDMVIGTPAYMAPEQLLAGPMDGRLDQYATAVICYELLCHKLPYASSSGMGLFSDIISGTPVPIRKHNSAFSPELEAVLSRMLSKEPAERFATIGEAWEALKKHLPE